MRCIGVCLSRLVKHVSLGHLVSLLMLGICIRMQLCAFVRTTRDEDVVAAFALKNSGRGPSDCNFTYML